jgi:N-acylglucosamine 2-epimerase
MDNARIDELTTIYERALFDDVLPFWIKNCVDYEFGGFTMALDRDGAVIDTDKSVWQQGRFTWLLGHLHNNFEKRDEWLELAAHGLDFIDKYCFDPEDGRMWFHLTRDGRPIRKRRYSFGETFACIAFGEYAKATKESKYAERAELIFHTYQNYLDSGRMAPKFTDVRPTQGMGRPMIDIVTCQTLRDTIELPGANDFIDKSIETIEKYFVKDDIRCVMETVGPNGEIYDHFDGRTLNPGHAIEGAWFIMNEGKIRGIQHYVDLGVKMLDYMWKRGWDDEFGGILYFRDVYDKPIQEYWQDMKFWWPQNETIIATLLAYQLTGDERYAEMHREIHDWTYSHFPDKEHGEWFGYLRRDGVPSTTLKGNMWKGPFHMPRQKIVCLKILKELKTQIQAEGHQK